MGHNTAKFLSYIFHPLLMAFYASIAMFYVHPHFRYIIVGPVKIIVLVTVLVSTFALPILSSLYFLQKGFIQSLQMHNSSERTLPFITTAIYYVTGYFLLSRLPIPNIFSAIVLGAGFAIVAALIINLYWKISIHMIGIGGVAGGLMAISSSSYTNLLVPMAILFILTGFLGTARLIYGSHNQAQVYVGFLLGFIIEFAVIYFYNAA